MKRAVWRRILQKRLVLNSSEEFAAAAREACPGITILHLKKVDIDIVRAELEKQWNENPPLSIKDTHSLHYIKPVSSTDVEVSLVSPFLPEIIPQLHRIHLLIFAVKDTNAPSRIIKIGTYVMVQYESSYFPGIVEEVSISGEVKVNAMRKCRGGWHWPAQKDSIWYRSIIKTVSAPEPVNSRGVYQFDCNIGPDIQQ